ncbi:hypothetical protein [Candidatus Gromoviella agglomerans]|uniref:hypothetical protein n=1 Tax=Candidatus Gromoviella agglomerans TaxID=2806609 RepID=UPI001E363037|nr:hypothetical protein [Candidatus Gromoviella agglomerans]UFX98263.1 hypothetical protein Gromo_00146 [Candidatus Gromoviella agglomerans]
MNNIKILKRQYNNIIDYKQVQSLIKSSEVEANYVKCLMTMAIQFAEVELNRILGQMTIEFKHSNSTIFFPYTPIIKIISVKYKDQKLTLSDEPSNNTYQYIVKNSEICGIYTTFPSNKDKEITVHYNAGYESTDDIPQTIKNSIIRLITFFYANPEKIHDNLTVSNIFQEYRSYNIA